MEDIVVVRKSPFSNPGAGADLLLMNTGNNLEDQTAIFAPEFISNPSDSRDVFIGNFDDDDWPDVVIANTFEDQPIFYHNLGNDADGNWLGLADESNTRFPVVLENDVLQFCALWAGDITGNGALDIYFSNYNPNGGSNDVLLINDGNGFFTDETISRMGDLRRSAFGTSAEIHDMDNDGDEDIIKISTLYDIAPWFAKGVFVLFNNGDGTFSNWIQIPSMAPYMFTVGDFNQDGLKDIYVVDDNSDYINMTTAVDVDNGMTFNTEIIPDPRANFFGGNVKLVDLDNNGSLDIGLADVDVDIPPCESGNVDRKFTLMRNTMGTISAPYGTNYYPWNESTYDFAFTDLNQDSLPDLFLGRCQGYEIFLNSATVEDCAISISGSTQICEGNTATLSASATIGTFNWSTGATEQEIMISEPGVYCVTVTNPEGCSDATCMQVFAGMDTETTLDVSICEGDTYNIGPNVYTETGDYQVVLTNVAGCDSTINLTLTVIPASITDNVVEICEGESFIVGDSIYTENGDYLNLLSSLDGCDSLVLTSLTVNPSYTTNFNEVICQGDSFEMAGQIFNMSGTYEVVLQTQEGCDSTFLLDLIVLGNSETELSGEICAGSSFEAGGMSFDETGEYTINLTNAVGCDSIINLTLQVEDQFETNISTSICAGDSYTISDQVFTEAGEYSVGLTASTGCDSTINLDLTVIEIPVLAIDYLLCEGDSVEVAGTIYDEAGSYEIVLSSQDGCDSVIDLSIATLPVFNTAIETEICAGEVFAIGDMVFDMTGDYDIMLQDQNGCDSLISLSLIVNEPSNSTLDLLLCDGEIITIEDQIFDEAGMYEVMTTNMSGCDSIITVDLAFTPAIELIDTMIFEISDIPGAIMLDVIGGVQPLSFEWSNGDTTQNLSTFDPGEYSVTVTDAEGCMVVYNFFLPLDVSVIKDPDLNFELSVFPNPSYDLVQFELFNAPSSEFNLIVYDVLGRVVHESARNTEKFELQLPAAGGTYFYQLNFGQGNIYSGRLIKQE